MVPYVVSTNPSLTPNSDRAEPWTTAALGPRYEALKRRVIGFMVAYMFAFDYRDGLYTTQRVIYVSPEHRGTRAAVLLAKELIRWSKLLGAAKIQGGNDNSFKSERTAAFLEHFGFKRVGYSMKKLLE